MVNTPPCQGGDRQFEPGRGRHNLLFIMKRHYTATALIVENNSVLLHYHEKIKMWLPPGGHIESNEDPIQAVIREVFEETGLKVKVVNTSSMNPTKYNNVHSIIPPYTIFIEPIIETNESKHEHIDFIYVCKISDGEIKNDNWIWFTKKDILKRLDESYNLSSDKQLTDELIDLCVCVFDLLEDRK